MNNELIEDLKLHGFKLVDGDYETWLSNNLNVVVFLFDSTLAIFDRNEILIDQLPIPLFVQTIKEVKDIVLKYTDVDLRKDFLKLENDKENAINTNALGDDTN